MNLWSEILLGEGKHLEFKESMPTSSNLIKTVVAFSNTGGGKILVGVNNEGIVVGLEEGLDILELQDKAASMIHDLCYPNIIPDIYTATIEGRTVLVIEVYRGNLLPYYIKKLGKESGTYLRIAATNRLASLENIQELERQRMNISFDQMVNPEWSFDDLDLTSLIQEFDRIHKPLDENRLISLKLIQVEKGKRYPTNGLLILLGKLEQVRIKCSRFKGTTMDVFLDRKEYSGDLFGQIRDVEMFVKNHITLQSHFDGLQRTDTYEVPLVAIRESLINAVVHRDYANAGRDIKIGIYDDRINIVSPGGFPSTLTAQDLSEGRSEIRNKVVARVLKELGYIEQWGSGIPRIRSSCRTMGLKEPVIRESGDFVDVSLFRGKELDLVREDLFLLSEQEQRILEWLNETGKGITTRIVMELLDVRERRARGILNHMTQRGILDHVGSTRTSSYILTEHFRR